MIFEFKKMLSVLYQNKSILRTNDSTFKVNKMIVYRLLLGISMKAGLSFFTSQSNSTNCYKTDKSALWWWLKFSTARGNIENLLTDLVINLYIGWYRQKYKNVSTERCAGLARAVTSLLNTQCFVRYYYTCYG